MCQQGARGSRSESSSEATDPNTCVVEERLKELIANAWNEIQQLNPSISPEGFAQLAYAVAASGRAREASQSG